MSVQLTPSNTRAFNGRTVQLKRRLIDRETGALGEAVATAFLLQQVREVQKAGRGHYAIDLLAIPFGVEVKAGCVSNSPAARVWRLTIGEPSYEEKAWLKTADEREKREWNERKQQAILERKFYALSAIGAAIGQPLIGKTVTCILDPDRQVVDVFEFIGFHERIGWESTQATVGFRGSFFYKDRP